MYRLHEADSLLLCYPVFSHALSRLGYLSQHILAGDVACAYYSGANGNSLPVRVHPAARSSDHRSIKGVSSAGCVWVWSGSGVGERSMVWFGMARCRMEVNGR
jgi:hypothetical protein